MTVQVLANYLAVGTQDCLSKSNQIRVEPNWCTHVFAPRIGFTESTCKDDYAVDLPKQERWNQFIRRGVAEKSSVEVKPTRKNLAHGPSRVARHLLLKYRHYTNNRRLGSGLRVVGKSCSLPLPFQETYRHTAHCVRMNR